MPTYANFRAHLLWVFGYGALRIFFSQLNFETMPYKKCPTCGGEGRYISGAPFYLALRCDAPGCNNGQIWIDDQPQTTNTRQSNARQLDMRDIPDSDGAPFFATLHEEGYANLKK